MAKLLPLSNNNKSNNSSFDGFASNAAAAGGGGGGAANACIKINVGGRLFYTTRTTLLRDNQSILARILLRCDQDLCLRDDCGNIFIDRNPRCFEHVLDYLRDGKFFCRPDELASLLNEAHYYRLLELAKAVQNEMLERREQERYAATALQQSNNSRSSTVSASGTHYGKRNSSPTVSLTTSSNQVSGEASSSSSLLMQTQLASVIVDLLKRVEDSCRNVWLFCSQIRVGDDGYLLVKRH